MATTARRGGRAATPFRRVLAAKAGAYIISPFVGRLDYIGLDGMDLIGAITRIYRNYGFTTQILAASLRGPVHVIEAAKAGADIATMPFKVLDSLFNHPLTDKGLAVLLKDWEKVFQEVPSAADSGLGRHKKARINWGWAVLRLACASSNCRILLRRLRSS